MRTLNPWQWGLLLGTIATLNILDILPDWTTIAAVLAMPVLSGARCGGFAAAQGGQ